MAIDMMNLGNTNQKQIYAYSLDLRGNVMVKQQNIDAIGIFKAVKMLEKVI